MKKKNKRILITIIIVLALILLFLLLRYKGISGGGIGSNDYLGITGSETMTRTAPIQATPGSTFQVTYTAQGVSGMWGASIIDTVSGGCTFPAGTQLKSVMLSDEGTTKTISVTAPSSGSCTFTGDYQFGNMTVKAFANAITNICQPNCVRPADLCLASSSNGCGGTCTWTVTKNTNADVNCNGIVDRSELTAYITKWLNNQVSRSELGQAIQAWAIS